jgi:hypothetical protein
MIEYFIFQIKYRIFRIKIWYYELHMKYLRWKINKNAKKIIDQRKKSGLYKDIY